MMNLKPCPLCGSHAEPVYDGDYYADFEFSIRCISKDCELVLPAVGRIDHNGGVLIEQKYIDHWNNR